MAVAKRKAPDVSFHSRFYVLLAARTEPCDEKEAVSYHICSMWVYEGGDTFVKLVFVSPIPSMPYFNTQLRSLFFTCMNNLESL